MKIFASLLKRQKILILILMPLVAGCVAAPGSHISSGGLFQLNDSYSEKVNTLPITPDLLMELNAGFLIFNPKLIADLQSF